MIRECGKKKLLTTGEIKMRLNKFMLQQMLEGTENKPDGQFEILDSVRKELREKEEYLEGIKNGN